MNPPAFSQFLLPLTVMPRGVKTSPRAMTAMISIGHASFRMRRTGSLARANMMTTPARVHIPCFRGRS